MPRKTIRSTEYAVFGHELRTLEDTIAFYEDQLRRRDRELLVTRTENVRLLRALEDVEIERGRLETDLAAERNSKMLVQGLDPLSDVQQTEVHDTRAENAKLKRRIASLELSDVQRTDFNDMRSENAQLKRRIDSLTCEEPGDDTLAEADLKRVAKRRQLTLPDAKYRIDVRGFFQYHEVRERWGDADPNDYNQLVQWFRGKNDRKSAPPGAKFWLDMLLTFGHDPQPYDEIPKNHPLKLHVEHMFCQNMMGEDSSLRNGMMNLFALEGGFNMSVEFKESNTRAKLAFFGSKTAKNHKAYVRWRDTKDNRYLPSMHFLQSVHCTDTELCAPRYMASGLRSTGRTRQLRLHAFAHKPNSDDSNIDEVN